MIVLPATYEPIATTTLGSAASSITFSTIPGTYTDLRLVLIPLGATTTIYPQAIFNNDTGTNYSQTILRGNGSSVSTGRGSNESNFSWAYMAPSTTVPALLTLDIFSYAGSTYKTSLQTSSCDLNGSGNVSTAACLWRSTSAITSITMNNFSSANFGSGTVATLYGILRA